MVALKRLIMEENSCDDVHLEVRALLRMQCSQWYPKVLSTFMDGANFYILMVRNRYSLTIPLPDMYLAVL
jgi:hypothetical protein